MSAEGTIRTLLMPLVSSGASHRYSTGILFGAFLTLGKVAENEVLSTVISLKAKN